MLAELCAAVLVIGLTAYAVLGGADFGAGFWDLTAGSAERGSRVRGMVKRSMGPVWEANHVWLIFVLVVMWTCFPPAFAAIMETLYIPIFLAGVGIILRGGAFALRGEAATIGEARWLGATFALSSVITPFFFGATIGAVAAGEVPADGAGDAWESWTGAVPLLAGAIAVVSGAFLAAVFMAADSVRAGLPDLVAAFRARALGAGVAAGALAIGGLALVNADAPDLFDGLTQDAGLVAVIASAVRRRSDARPRLAIPLRHRKADGLHRRRLDPRRPRDRRQPVLPPRRADLRRGSRRRSHARRRTRRASLSASR